MQSTVKSAFIVSLTSAAHLFFGLMLMHLFIRHYMFHEIGVFTEISLGFMALLWGFTTFMSKLDQRQYDQYEAATLRRHEITRQLYDRWCSHDHYQTRIKAWTPLAELVASGKETTYSKLPENVREHLGQISHFFADFYVLWHSNMLEPKFAQSYFSTALPSWARVYVSTITDLDGYDTRHPLLNTTNWQQTYLLPCLRLILSWDEHIKAYAATQGKPPEQLLATYADMRKTVKAAYPTLPAPAKA